MNQLSSALGDPLGLQIDVSDLEAKWQSGPVRTCCAACGRMLPEGDTPLLLWRREGTQILVLDWECAQLRMLSIGERN